METFLTIQGEGRHSGRTAWFIRLAGCDVGCVWCDVKESWDAEEYPTLPVKDLSLQARNSGAGFVVVTGGEPAMYNLTELTNELNAHGLELAIETSGAHELTGNWHWICFSPKKFKQPVESIYAKANELKVVVYNKHDLQWAQEHAARVNENCQLYLQPEWDRKDQMIPLIIAFIKAHPEWRMSLQTHKYMNIP